MKHTNNPLAAPVEAMLGAQRVPFLAWRSAVNRSLATPVRLEARGANLTALAFYRAFSDRERAVPPGRDEHREDGVGLRKDVAK